MIQGSDGAGFAREPSQGLGIARDVLGKDLEGDVARQTRIMGAVDRAHTAGAERSADLVRTESGSGHEGHGQPSLFQGAPTGKEVASGGPLAPQGPRCTNGGFSLPMS
jgi:hypothetical protein